MSNYITPPPKKNKDDEVIIIPPNCIYGYQNDKVIDNQIDHIYINGVRRVKPDNHYNISVYNEDIYSGFNVQSEPLNDKEVQLFNTAVNINNPVILFYGSYVYADNQYYISKVVNVPIQQDISHKVIKLLLGESKDGRKEIEYVVSGKINKGTTNSSIGISANTNGVAVQSWSSFAIPPIGDNGYRPTETTEGSFYMPTEYSRTTVSENGDIVLTAKIDIPTKDNLGTITATEVTIDGQQYLQLDIQNLLCGIRINEVGGRGTALPLATNKTALSGTISGGTYTEYIPEKVTITVYGNTIGLSFTEETICVGDKNGKNPYRMDGNELMQIIDVPKTDPASVLIEQRSLPQKARTLSTENTPTLKSWNDYYDDETQKLTYKYKLDQAKFKLEEFYKKHNFNFTVDEYLSSKKELEEIIGFKYKRLFAPILKESVDLTDKYIGNSKENYKVFETENENSVVGIQFVPTYVQKTIEIPTFLDNEEVVNFIIGTDYEEETNEEDKEKNKQMVLRLYGTVNKGNAINTLTHKGNEVSFNWEDTEYEQQETSEEDCRLLKTTEKYLLDNGAMIELEFDSEDNRVTVNNIKTENYITTVDLTILCGLKVTKLGSIYKPTSKNGTADMDGIYEEFIPHTCEITIFGNTVELRL